MPDANKKFRFEDDGHLDAVEHDWGTLIRYFLPDNIAPWQVWTDIAWPEVQPGKMVLLAGDGPDWLERELEERYTPFASIVAHISPNLALAPPPVLARIASNVRLARVEQAMKHGIVAGRSRPRE